MCAEHQKIGLGIGQSTDNCSAGFSLVQSRIQADPYAGVDLREKCVQFFLRLCADLSFHIVGLEPAFIGDVESMHERDGRSEEHTSELQSLMRISYAVFCLKK